MRILLILLAAILPLQAGGLKKKKLANRYDFQDGDIVLQGDASIQARAVTQATDSPYTHCGVVFEHEGKWMVIEAIQPVQVTSMENFASRSMPGTFKAMRLKKPVPAENVRKAYTWAEKQKGKNYDVQFRWDDEKLYCSEFVWKLYEQAGVELCEKRPFRDYNLDAPMVKAMINQRYGDKSKLPLDEPAVAPSDIAASKLLVEVPRLEQAKKN